MNYTDEQIIKVLECCAKNNCTYDCPFYHDSCIKCRYSSSEIIKFAFDIIKRLKAENEQLCKRIKSQKKALFEQQSYTAELQAENERLKNKCEDCAGCSAWKCDCSNIRNEFAERLKEIGQKRLWICGITETDIDNLLKEMVGDKK